MNGLHVDITVPLKGFTVSACFDTPQFGIASIFGPSGSGKTTILRSIAGLEPRARGLIRVKGETWLDSEAGTSIPTHNRRVGYVFQEASLFPHLNVANNLRYGYQRNKQSIPKISFDDAVEWSGVGPLLERKTTDLSGGERQRVALARAILSNPTLILMDEPLASLDEISRAAILPYIHQLHGQLAIPVLYVSHVVREVARLADTIIELRAGQVIATGPAPEMLQRIAAEAYEGEDAIAIIDWDLVHHDAHYHLSEGTSAFGTIWISSAMPTTTPKRRIQISARDVSLGLLRDEQSSILNQFPVEVVQITQTSPSQTLVRLAPRGFPDGPCILSLITRKSAETLALRLQKHLWARIKSVRTLA